MIEMSVSSVNKVMAFHGKAVEVHGDFFLVDRFQLGHLFNHERYHNNWLQNLFVATANTNQKTLHPG